MVMPVMAHLTRTRVQAILNEKNSPDILNYEGDVVSSLQNEVSKQVRSQPSGAGPISKEHGGRGCHALPHAKPTIYHAMPFSLCRNQHTCTQRALFFPCGGQG